MKYIGRIWKFGSDVDTDAIIPARYLNTSDPIELAVHCMDDADPDFAAKVKPGDILVAGKNFGCGSSREHAPLAIRGAGVSCVIAHSFARIFYRNAINLALPIFECPELVEKVESGDRIEVNPATGEIKDLVRNTIYRAVSFPEFMQELIRAGGLIEYAAERMKKK